MTNPYSNTNTITTPMTTPAMDAPDYQNNVFDFSWCLQFFAKKGTDLFGPGFRISPADYPVIYQLLVYFLGMETEAAKFNISLKKGIMLTGPIGCGKTCWMHLMQWVSMPPHNHVMKSCREVSFEFMQYGYPVVYRYSTLSFSQQSPRIYCFDDLGLEQNLKYYGNECNVMGEVLPSRYDMFVKHGMITHLTTNLSASELETAYGNRLRSRMREMFNLVSFSKDSTDKRK